MLLFKKLKIISSAGPSHVFKSAGTAGLSYLQTQQTLYAFTWQGGEPALMGIDFFKQAVKLQRDYSRPGSRVANGLQTNALLIDDEFAGFFARNNFLLGISLDDPAYVHDHYRKYKNGTGSYQNVIKGIDHLVRNGAQFKILTLVSQANVKKAEKFFDFCVRKVFLPSIC